MDTADVRAATERLLASDRLTEPTRAVLRARLDRRFGAPQTFDAAQMRTLAVAAARLVPADPQVADVIDLAAAFDAALAEGTGDGWRYAELPMDAVLHRMGLDALDARARRDQGAGFAELDEAAQIALLTSAAGGRLEMAVDSARWFEELLSGLVELHYAHPLSQVAIGYDGMADARGWQAIGLDAVAREAGDGD